MKNFKRNLLTSACGLAAIMTLNATNSSVSSTLDNNNSNECYGASVIEVNQMKKKDGSDVLPQRSNPQKAIGAPQMNSGMTFFSLGYGGSITIGFDGVVPNGPGNDITIVETTFGASANNPNYEAAEIFVSQDGSTFFSIGTVGTAEAKSLDISDAGVPLSYITMVKVVDTTSSSSISDDGFDLDGIIAIHGCLDEVGGCYAESAMEYQVGTTKNGGAVDLNRTNPINALGEPQGTDSMVFTTLGYGGYIVLGFGGNVINGPGADLEFTETSYGQTSCNAYPEYATVYVTQDGVSWTEAGTVCKWNKNIYIPESFSYITAVKVENDNAQSFTTDGYDLDGVKALHNCQMYDIAQQPSFSIQN